MSRSVVLVTGLALLAALAPVGTGAASRRPADMAIRTSGNVTLSEADPAASPDPATNPATNPGTDQTTTSASPAPADPATDPTPSSAPSDPATTPADPAGTAWPFVWRDGIRPAGAGINRLSAGGIRSLRFTLGGDRGLGILAPGYPVSQRFDCTTGRLIPLSRYRTRPLGRAGLSYDAASKRYTYAWQTREEWSNTCRRFTIKLTDGTTRAASFRIDTFRFIAPTKRFPRVNDATPGATVPVAFHLGASARLDIWSGVTPRSRQIDCATGDPLGAWEPTAPAGTAGLTRTAARQDYRYAWTTDAAWAQTCRAFEMRMKDGTVQQLRFRFNRPPTAVDDSGTGFTTDQSAAFTTANVLDNDSDPDSDPLTITAVDQAGLTGTLTDNADGTFDYDPGSSFDGLGQGESDTDSFGYTIADPSGATDSATVSITVNGLNDTPVLDDQNRSVAEDAENGDNVGIPLAFSDVDVTDTHTLEITGGNTGGAFAIDDSGQITVADATELDAGATPTYTLTVKVTDDAPTPASDTATITVTVTDVNRTPVAQAATPTVTEDTTTTITLTATDADGDALSFDVPGASTNGATIDNPGTVDCSTTPKTCTRTYDYHPIANSNADDSFTFTVSDGTNTSAAATVSITITAVNDAPALDASKSPTLGTVNEDAPAPVGAVGVLVSSLVDFAVPVGQVDNVTDVDSGAQLGIAIDSFDVANGDLYYSLNGGTSWELSGTRSTTNALLLAADSDNRVYFRPKANINGTITLAMRIRAWDRTSGSDGATGVTVNGGSPSGAFSSATDSIPLTVTAVNDAPVITTTAGGITYDVGSTAAVIDSGLTIVDVDDPDLEGATVAITSGLAKPEDTLDAPGPLPGGITASYSGAAGELTLSGTASVADYQAALRRVTFANLDLATTTGPRTITFTATDGSNTSADATRSITVQVANAAPVAAAQTLSTSSGIRVTIGSGATGKLLRGASDGNDPVSDLRVSSTFTNVLPVGSVVTLIDAATGTYSFDPPGGYTGSGSFDYEICDDGVPIAPAKCDTATVTVTIGGTDLWFVDDSAAAGGDGRLTAPYQSLASLPSGRGNGDRIFVFSGSYATGHTFLSSERLIGQGSSGSFDTLLGVSVPSDGTLDTRPTLSGSAPTLGGTVTLFQASTLRGVAISSGTASGLTDDSDGALTGIDVSETSVTTTTGTPLMLGVVAGSISLSDLDTNGALRGIDLASVDAAVTIGSGATIANTSVAGISISGGTGTFTYNGTITVSAGRAVSVANRTGTTPGAVTFGGAITATGGTGISLTTNTTGSIAFTGGLSLSTGTNAAFTATGGGTVTATQNNSSIVNTLTTTSATALTVTNTTIGAAGLTFRSISVNGAGTGISLNTTGSSGGLTVTGQSTTDGSGGTIQNTTTRGASFISTASVRLSNMQFTNAALDGPNVPTDLSVGGNTGDNAAIHLQAVDGATFENVDINGSQEHGVNAHDVRNLALRNSTIVNAGQTVGEDGLHAYHLTGPNTAITATTISGSGSFAARIENNPPVSGGFASNGTITVASSTFTSSVADGGLAVATRGTNTTILSISASTFTNNNTDGVSAIGYGGSTLNVTVGTSTLTGNFKGIEIIADGTTSNVDFNVDNNTAIKQNDTYGIHIEKSRNSGTSVMEGFIQNNADIDTEIGRSAPAIWVVNSAGGTLSAVIANNTIDYAGSDFGMRLETGDNGTGRLNAIVRGNLIRLGGEALDASGDPVGGIFATSRVNSSTGDGAILCAEIGGSGIAGNTVTHPGTAAVPQDILLRQAGPNTVALPLYFGSSTDPAAVETYLGGRNILVTAADVTRDSGSFGGLPSGCPTPST